MKITSINWFKKDKEGLKLVFLKHPPETGGYRSILNLKSVNEFFKNQHFKMLSLKSILQAFNTGVTCTMHQST